MKKILIFILVLTIIILGMDFFVKSGTYFLLDGTFFPLENLRYSFWEASIFWFFNDLFTIIFGYILYSKIFYFSIIFFSGLLGYLLSKEIIELSNLSMKYIDIAGIFGIIFMIINPFFYERMITQPGIYLAILWLGYGLYFLLKNLTADKLINYLLSGFFFGLGVAISQHTIFMIGIILITFLLLYLRDKKTFFNIFCLGFVVIFLNLNWLIGNFYFGVGNVLNSVNSFGQANIDNFLTNGLKPLNAEFTNTLLYGFWGERYGHFILPDKINDRWYIAGFLIFFIILFGIYKTFNKNKKITLFLVILGVISLVLGVGTASNLWGGLTQFLYDYVPYYTGLREPQKWIGLLMLVYCIFFVNGITYIFSYFDKFFNILRSKIKSGISILVIFLFLNAWSPNIILGFNKQLFMTDYPKEFAEYKKENIVKGETYLVLPWHSYFACAWTKSKIIPNIMGEIFKPGNIITSDNIEIGNLYTNSTSPRSKDIETFLKTNDISLLKKYNINNIIFLDKCADFKRYNFLNENKNIQKKYDSLYLKSYKIN